MQLADAEIGLHRPLFLIAGPCVIETEALALSSAATLREFDPPHRYSMTFKFTNFDDATCKVIHELKEVEGGTEYTFSWRLPYCPQCRPTAARNPLGKLHVVLMIGLVTVGLFLALVWLFLSWLFVPKDGSIAIDRSHIEAEHRALGRMKVLILVLPKFDPEDEWFDD